MGFGGAQSMNTVMKNNRLMKGERKTIYDRKDSKRSGRYGETMDHKKMKSHEFAAFQKEQFIKRAKERRRDMLLKTAVALITLAIVLLFLYLWNSSDADLLISPEFR